MCCSGRRGRRPLRLLILYVHRGKECGRIKFGSCAVCGRRAICLLRKRDISASRIRYTCGTICFALRNVKVEICPGANFNQNQISHTILQLGNIVPAHKKPRPLAEGGGEGSQHLHEGVCAQGLSRAKFNKDEKIRRGGFLPSRSAKRNISYRRYIV